MTNAITPTGGLTPETLSKLIANGDLSGLTDEQRTQFYVYRCNALGLDPATQPFEFIRLSGKLVLYAKKECANQLSQRQSLSATIVGDGMMGGIYRVQARVTTTDGRVTDDIGCVNVEGLSGESLCNAMMKAATKAKRRTILGHCGLGMLDESEVDSIRPEVEAPRPKATPPVAIMQGTTTSEDEINAKLDDAAQDMPESSVKRLPEPPKLKNVPNPVPATPKAQASNADLNSAIETFVGIVEGYTKVRPDFMDSSRQGYGILISGRWFNTLKAEHQKLAASLKKTKGEKAAVSIEFEEEVGPRGPACYILSMDEVRQ